MRLILKIFFVFFLVHMLVGAVNGESESVRNILYSHQKSQTDLKAMQNQFFTGCRGSVTVSPQGLISSSARHGVQAVRLSNRRR
jgi:hypothetical protein